MNTEMDLGTANDSGSRFSGYVEGLVSMIGHADRAGPLRDYCIGLMLPCERKSVEPMATVMAPERTATPIAFAFLCQSALDRNTHRIEVDSDTAHFCMSNENEPSEYPRTRPYCRA